MKGLIEIRTNINNYYFELLYKLLNITIFIFIFHYIAYNLEIKNVLNNGIFGKKLLNKDFIGIVITIWLTILFHDLILNKVIVIKNN